MGTAFDIKNNVDDWFFFLFRNTINMFWYPIEVIHIKPNYYIIHSGIYKARYIFKVPFALSEFCWTGNII